MYSMLRILMCMVVGCGAPEYVPLFSATTVNQAWTCMESDSKAEIYQILVPEAYAYLLMSRGARAYLVQHCLKSCSKTMCDKYQDTVSSVVTPLEKAWSVGPVRQLLETFLESSKQLVTDALLWHHAIHHAIRSPCNKTPDIFLDMYVPGFWDAPKSLCAFVSRDGQMFNARPLTDACRTRLLELIDVCAERNRLGKFCDDFPHRLVMRIQNKSGEVVLPSECLAAHPLDFSEIDRRTAWGLGNEPSLKVRQYQEWVRARTPSVAGVTPLAELPDLSPSPLPPPPPPPASPRHTHADSVVPSGASDTSRSARVRARTPSVAGVTPLAELPDLSPSPLPPPPPPPASPRHTHADSVVPSGASDTSRSARVTRAVTGTPTPSSGGSSGPFSCSSGSITRYTNTVTNYTLFNLSPQNVLIFGVSSVLILLCLWIYALSDESSRFALPIKSL